MSEHDIGPNGLCRHCGRKPLTEQEIDDGRRALGGLFDVLGHDPMQASTIMIAELAVTAHITSDRKAMRDSMIRMLDDFMEQCVEQDKLAKANAH